VGQVEQTGLLGSERKTGGISKGAISGAGGAGGLLGSWGVTAGRGLLAQVEEGLAELG
jgi:hypothetical protein